MAFSSRHLIPGLGFPSSLLLIPAGPQPALSMTRTFILIYNLTYLLICNLIYYPTSGHVALLLVTADQTLLKAWPPPG